MVGLLLAYPMIVGLKIVLENLAGTQGLAALLSEE